MEFLLFCLVASSWGIGLFDAAANRGWEPFRSLAYQARISNFYSQHAPEKLGLLQSSLRKWQGKEEKLVSKLQEKYGHPVESLEIASLANTCAAVGYERILRAAPPQVQQYLERAWSTWCMGTPLGKQFLAVTLTALVLVTGGGLSKRFAADPETRAANFFFYEMILLVLLLRPSPFALDRCSPAALWSTARHIWSSLIDGQSFVAGIDRPDVVIVTGAAMALAYLRERRARRGVLIAYLACVLVMTNPGLGYESPDKLGQTRNKPNDATVIAALESVTARGQTGRRLYQRLPEGTVAVHDLGLVSIATWSKRAVNASPGKKENTGSKGGDLTTQTHSWLSPVVSVGMGGKWRGTIEASMSKGAAQGAHDVKLRGRAMFPAWAVPMASFLFIWALMHLPI